MQTNNNSPLKKHCFNCAKSIQSSGPNPIQKRDYPVSNQKTDSIILEKHFLCLKCSCGFDSAKTFVAKYRLKGFSKEFKLDRVIDSSFMKMANFDPSFTKQNKRQSQILNSVSNNQAEEQQSQLSPKKQDILLNTALPQEFNLNLPTDIYSAIISDTIESENLHYVSWLPKTLQYMISLTSPQRMRPQERRQRVKKTLQAVSYIYCIDQCQLKYLAILIQTLFCYMNQDAMLKILDKLLKGFMQNNVSLQFFLVEQDHEEFSPDYVFQQRHLHQKSINYRPDCALQIIFSLFILFDFFNDTKLQRHFSQLVHLAHEELNKLSQSSSNAQFESQKKLQKKFEAYLKKTISDRSKLNRLSESSWQQIIEGKKQKNQLNLIINTMKREQEENQELIKEMENKYKKQKDEYINKIIKLNNQIADLQAQLKTFKENGAMLLTSRKNSKILKLKDDDQQVKSNPEMKILNIKEPKKQPITERTEVPISEAMHTEEKSEVKKHKSQIQVHKEGEQGTTDSTMNYLMSILQITDLINFNNKANKKTKKQSASFPLPQLPTTIKELSQVIIIQISNLVKKTSSLMQQNKKFREQSTRLLGILKRKEQSWLPLLHEKDEIISLYEKALLCMEKGLILPEEPLSSRIQTIVENVSKIKFKKLESQKSDDYSVRDSTSVRSSLFEDFPEDMEISIKSCKSEMKEKTLPKQKKEKQVKIPANPSNEKGTENKIKKKTKKEKEKEKECLIY